MAQENHFHEQNMADVIEAARVGVEPKPLPGIDNAVFVPLAHEGRIEDLQHFLPNPRRKKGTITVFDAGSFNAVMDQNAGAGIHTVYIDRNVDAPSIVGIMNDHGSVPETQQTSALEILGWRDFRVQIELRQTPQWKKWRAMDGRMVSQLEFAEFIEDNLADIDTPTGAEMLEIVTYLQATRTVKFESGMRLSNGSIQFVNKDDIEARVGAGKIEVPETFKLALTPYQGLALYSIPARFRYRLSEGKLVMGLKLERVENLMNQVLDEITGGISCPDIIYGKPGA